MPPRRRRRGRRSVDGPEGRGRGPDRGGLVRFLFDLGQTTGDPQLRKRSIFAIQQAAKAAGFKSGNDFFRGIIKGFRGGNLTPNQSKAVFGLDTPRASFRFTASTDGLTGTVRVAYGISIDYDINFELSSFKFADRINVTKEETAVSRFTVGRDNLEDIIRADAESKIQDIVDDHLKDTQETSFIADTVTTIRSVNVTLNQVDFG